MSYVTPVAHHAATVTKVARLSAAVRRSWTEARQADRQLMAMRTNLTRHSG
jgi:hypothetical protein